MPSHLPDLILFLEKEHGTPPPLYGSVTSTESLVTTSFHRALQMEVKILFCRDSGPGPRKEDTLQNNLLQGKGSTDMGSAVRNGELRRV